MNIFVGRPRRPHRRRFIMKARRRRRTSLPIMMTDLMFASWETVARRALLIAENKCSPAEYSRMFQRKGPGGGRDRVGTHLERRQGRTGFDAGAMEHRRAVANARRLRK